MDLRQTFSIWIKHLHISPRLLLALRVEPLRLPTVFPRPGAINLEKEIYPSRFFLKLQALDDSEEGDFRELNVNTSAHSALHPSESDMTGLGTKKVYTFNSTRGSAHRISMNSTNNIAVLYPTATFVMLPTQLPLTGMNMNFTYVPESRLWKDLLVEKIIYVSISANFMRVPSFLLQIWIFGEVLAVMLRVVAGFAIKIFLPGLPELNTWRHISKREPVWNNGKVIGD
jgi:hypothetical protein